MEDRLFLYIDILGFSELVSKSSEVMQLYNIIDRLNVFEHEPHFKCLVFSDTILVYSEPNWPRNSSLIMWMCEFAQDLFYRLIGRNIHFRAILTSGEFRHSKMKHIDAFFGEALVKAYQDEKEIVCMGLFIDAELAPLSSIFETT